MSDRVNDTDVRKIIDTELTDISAFISVANMMVTEVLGGQGLGANQLKEIERWMAAHFIAIRDPRTLSEKMDDASVRYALATPDKGFRSTPYGEQVLLLDTSGRLAKVGQSKPTIETY